MKKVILGMVLLAQFTYGMETVPDFSDRTTTLVSSRFLEESEARFRTNLESMLRSVTEGNTTPEAAIVSLRGDHRESLVMLRSSLNQEYLHQLEAQRIAQEELIHRITTEKEHEIQVLQERLDALLHSSGSASESLRIFDQERRHAEENVRRTREQAEHSEIPELVTERQVDRTSRRFGAQLDEIKREVQESRRTLEEAFEKTQEKYGDNIDALIGNLQDRYEDILASITSQYNERREHMEEAYEQQKALMQRMIDEVTAINLKLEKEKELADIIHGIYLSNPSNPFLFSRSFIRDNVQEIRAINDLSQRRSRVEALYNKFKLFSSIYGREDLGVKAKSSDLNAIKSWLDRTTNGIVLGRYGIATNFSGKKINGYHNEEEGKDCPRYRKHEVDGRCFLGNLNNAIERLRRSTSSNVQVKSRLEGILNSTKAASDNVQIIWDHTTFYGHSTNRLRYWLNGQELGSFFHEYGGKFWKITSGFLGNFNGPYWVRWGSGDARDVWNSQFVVRFNSEIDNIQNAIKRRAMLLFDFETNPESELQKFYKRAGIVPTLTLPFPSIEIDNLIKQCNDFIKRSIS